MVMGLDKKLDMLTGLRCFSFKELNAATNKFAPNQKLGKGGFGTVYVGYLADKNSPVAVKRMSSQSVWSEKEFTAEVEILGQLRHRNIVKLVGWCIHKKKEFLLVYEFVPNKSLDFHLFDEQACLPFEIRYRIALDLASALRRLQEEHEYERSIIHRDVKSSNVFLDDNFNPELGDFGLAHVLEHGEELINTDLAGTPGYMDPEYLLTGKVTKKSDIYGFGIVALELASGKHASKRGNGNSWNLVEWVEKHYRRENVLAVADPKLGDSYVPEQMECLIIVGLACANQIRFDRPSIQDVIDVLNAKAPLSFMKLPPVHHAASMDDLSASESSSCANYSTREVMFFTNEFFQATNEQNYVSKDSETHCQSVVTEVKISAVRTMLLPPVHVTASCINLSASESSSSHHGSYSRNEMTFSGAQETTEKNYVSNNSQTRPPLVASDPRW